MDRNERIAINQRADPSAPRRPIWDFNLPKTILKSGAAQNAFAAAAAAVGLINGLAWRRQTGPTSLVLWRRRRSLRSESIRFAAPRAARASAAAAELR